MYLTSRAIEHPGCGNSRGRKMPQVASASPPASCEENSHHGQATPADGLLQRPDVFIFTPRQTSRLWQLLRS